MEDNPLRLGPEGNRGPWRAEGEQGQTWVFEDVGRTEWTRRQEAGGGVLSQRAPDPPPGSLPDFTPPPPSTNLLLSFQLGLHRLTVCPQGVGSAGVTLGLGTS